MNCASCATRCVGWLVQALRGACCRRTFRHGRRGVSANSTLAVSGLLRSDGSRFAFGAACCAGSSRSAQCGGLVDGRTLHSSCESGPRAGYDGDKLKRASTVHRAVDTLGHWLAVHVTPANEQARAGSGVGIRGATCERAKREACLRRPRLYRKRACASRAG